MAGHNKWSQIKHKKAKEDAKKSKAFTHLTREITMAARASGGDPAFNPQLRHLLEKARAINMPLENTTRAIKRGTGELPGVHYEAIMYEGYAPHGISVIIETLTDNKNRTVAELRFIFSSHGGNLGESGSVSWMFERLGVITLSGSVNEDKLMEELIEYDIKDIKRIDQNVSILCDPKSLDTIKTVLKTNGYTVDEAEFSWIAKNQIALSDEQSDQVVELLSELHDHEDVQNIYTSLA